MIKIAKHTLSVWYQNLKQSLDKLNFLKLRNMGHKMAHKNIFTITALATALALVGCGGGGSEGYYNNGSNNGSNNGGTTTESVNISSLELLDKNGDITKVITAEGVVAKVKVTDATGKGISGALVTFEGEGVTFATSNSSVLTNADGEASISIKPIDANTTGAYQLSATVTHNQSTKTTPSYTFQLQAANIVFVNMAAANTSLESGASTNITLKTQDANTNVNQNNVTVNFSTSCGTFEPASVVSSNQGDVTTSYKAIDANGQLCEGKQTITAAGSDSKSIEINVTEIKANSIVYTTSTATNLGILQSGSASSGQIEFTLYANGVPAANKDVTLELLRGPEGLSFISFGNREIRTLKSDPNGKVIVTLYPGDKPGPVEIKATLTTNNQVFALSKNVVISTGRVTQNGLSLSVSKNSLQNKIDGDTATITARMVDRNGNPVPDGTVISFVTEGGSITPNCSSIEGICSVTLSTQDPRPLNNRVTVLAYVEGDKSYIDKNGDNLYTAGIDELISNIGDFFRDDNEDTTYNSANGEFIYKRNAGTNSCAASTLAQPNIANTCDNNLTAIIRQQLIFAFAENTPTFTNVSANGSLLSFNMYGNSAQEVPMPSGTSISVTAEDNTESNNKSCSAEFSSGSSPVASVFNLLRVYGEGSNYVNQFRNNSQTYYGYRLKDCAVGDVLKVSVSSPDSKVSTIYVSYQ